MDQQTLKKIFEERYDREDWQKIAREIFGADSLLTKPTKINIASNEWQATGVELGNFETTDGRLVGLYELTIGDKAQLHRNRKGLRELLKTIYQDVDSALVVFVQGVKWRFSYVSEIYTRNAETGKREKKATDPKRYTYLLGEGERSKTAADRFARIRTSSDLFKTKGVLLQALEEAFNVEKMSKDFFNAYRKHYGAFTAYLTGEDENSKEVCKPAASFTSVFNKDKKSARDFVKKLLGRIVFMYFLEKKGWLGVKQTDAWGDGDENFLSNLFRDTKHKELFHPNVLVPLFYQTLNTERKDELFKVDKNEFTKGDYDKQKVPFLNGGLFENDMPEADGLVFPAKLFANLFEFFDQYNFTVYEDSPDEHTVAVDPEMLGHVFENLLEDNKDKGAFYTPKEIVHYMCEESLIEYLYTKLNPQESTTYQELGTAQTNMFGNEGKKGQLSLVQKHEAPKGRVKREWIEKFIKHQEAKDIADFDKEILIALRNVKVCDPAIGSGAFPMGILMEIYHAVETLFDLTRDTVNDLWKLGTNAEFNAAKVKADIIQNSIYGVDIEKGAVDIARLRFWLSLVVDETKPRPLPNLDYKIVVGNSLLSKFEDDVIDIEWNYTTSHGTAETKKIIIEQVTKFQTLHLWQQAYFIQKGNKQKSQTDIRNLKIDILINQLTLSKISFQQSNPKLGGFAPTAKQIQKNVENQLIVAGYDKNIQKLKNIKADKNAKLEFFDWKIDFPEVMNKVDREAEGFDIILANPPYVKVQSIDKSAADFFKNRYLSATGKYDLYVIFIEQSFKLLKRNGCMMFINPHRFLIAEYGIGIRKLLLTKRGIKCVLHFGVEQIFETATTYTGVFLFKENSEELFHAKPSSARLDEAAFSSKKYSDEDFDFNLSDKDENNNILKKIQEHKKVSEVFEGVYQGIIPMGDDIQVFKGRIKGESFIGYSNALEKEVVFEKGIVKKLLKGENIIRYQKCSSDLYIFYPHYTDQKGKTKPLEENRFKKEFPLAFAYISNFKHELKDKKIKYKTNPIYWYSLHRCREQRIFEAQKILTPQLQNKPNFTIDSHKFYPDAGGYSILKRANDKIELKAYLAIFNSSLFYYFIKCTSTPFNNNYYYFKTNYIEPFCIPRNISSYSSFLSDKVKQIIHLKDQGSANFTALERDIDNYVYKLYNLTYDEASTIEGNKDWMTKEEYEAFTLTTAQEEAI